MGGSPSASAAENTALGAVMGTALGAAVGAALGSAAGHAGTGAAISAGTGLLAGTAVGANADQAFRWNAQRHYDIAYQQCMYAKGNQLPGAMLLAAVRARELFPAPAARIPTGACHVGAKSDGSTSASGAIVFTWPRAPQLGCGDWD